MGGMGQHPQAQFDPPIGRAYLPPIGIVLPAGIGGVGQGDVKGAAAQLGPPLDHREIRPGRQGGQQGQGKEQWVFHPTSSNRILRDREANSRRHRTKSVIHVAPPISAAGPANQASAAIAK